MLILQSPSLFANYIHKTRYITNLREVRCFLSFLSKYEIFDSMKVLEYSKRLFKVLYDCEKDSFEVETLLKSSLATPLSEMTEIGVLEADSENLTRLSIAVEKFKAKIKTCAIKKKKSSSTIPIEKQQFLELSFADHSKYAASYDYPFNDSDGYIEKLEMLEPIRFRQPVSKGEAFAYQKYLKWMLIRTGQEIDHYLVFENQSEADEEMKKLENMLKTSFNSSPSDKLVHDHKKNILDVFAQSVGEEVSRSKNKNEIGMILPNISSIPMVV